MAASGAPAVSLAEDAALIREAVRLGGAIALEHFDARPATWSKDDGSPVSEADMAVDAALSAHLRGARPAYGFVSEESEATGTEAARSFVVDPIDGTRAFLKGEAAWTIVVAIIEHGRPVNAAIFQPATGALYGATLGLGAQQDGLPITISRRAEVMGATLSMPHKLFREAKMKEAGAVRAASVPSLALRLARVGTGDVDAAVTKAGAHHWDLAAADLIVHEAGGTFTRLDGSLVRYDTPATSHGPLVAGPAPLARLMREIAARHVKVAA